MDAIGTALGLDAPGPGHRLSLPRLPIVDALDFSRPTDRHSPPLRQGRWRDRELLSLRVEVDTGSRTHRLAPRDVVAIRFPGRRLPAFSAEWHLGIGTAAAAWKRVAPSPAGLDPGWRLHSEYGKLPAAGDLLAWLGKGRQLDASGGGSGYQAQGEWIAVDAPAHLDSASEMQAVADWLDLALSEADALAALLPDVPQPARPAASVRRVDRSGVTAAAPAARRAEKETSWPVIALAMVAMTLPVGAFLFMGLVFIDEIEEMGPLASTLAWILMIAVLIAAIARQDRLERREIRAQDSWRRMVQVLMPMCVFTLQTSIGAALIVLFCRLID